MRELKLSTGSFDQVNTFNVVAPGKYYPMRCALHRGYHKRDDGVLWVMQHSTVIKDSYSDEDRAESARLRSEGPLVYGDQVMVEGKVYTLRVLGDYSDCAILDEVKENSHVG